MTRSVLVVPVEKATSGRVVVPVRAGVGRLVGTGLFRGVLSAVSEGRMLMLCVRRCYLTSRVRAETGA